MGYIKLYILFVLVINSHQATKNRLPENSVPHHYKLKFVPHMIPNNFSFSGESEITLEILNPTKNLTLHSQNLRIEGHDTALIKGGTIIEPERIIFEKEQLLILIFRKNLEPGNYTLQLKYTGVLNDEPEGFFWSSYVNSNNETIYLVATNLQPTNARRVFPCWDEPAFKATFEISIKHFPNYTALSNMPLKKKNNETDIVGKIWTEFKTTPAMSTYAVSFAVTDFVNTTNPEGNFSIWSRREILDCMEIGHNVGFRAIPVLEEFTRISYQLPKIDVITIPEFRKKAMGTWGLIILGFIIRIIPTLREEYLNRKDYSVASEKIETSELMVYVVAHQWMGNLVGPHHWIDYWVIEGLAQYLKHFLTGKVMHVPRLMDYLMIRNYHELFINDADPASLAIYRKENDGNDVFEDLYTFYSKSAVVMHMLSGLLSEEVFHIGIRKILQRHKFKSITTDDFWNIMQETLNESKPISNFDLKMVMEPYISQPGYPVINVSRNYKTGKMKLTQQCSVCQFDKNNKTEYKWWIPINFSTTSATHWMDPNKEELVISGTVPNDWIILNLQSTGYYRVNYDRKNWRKISKYLNSDKFTNIHVLNRARLLNDALQLREEEKLEGDLFVSLISYLKYEKDLVPWIIGDEILRYLGDTIERDHFWDLVLELVNPLFNETSLDNGDDDLFTILKRETATLWRSSFDKLGYQTTKIIRNSSIVMDSSIETR